MTECQFLGELSLSGHLKYPTLPLPAHDISAETLFSLSQY